MSTSPTDGWHEVPCAVGCDDPIPAPPSCTRAWHHACADEVFRREAADRAAERQERAEKRRRWL